MNVIFDVGNVIVRWSPVAIMHAALAANEVRHQQIEDSANRFFSHEIWRHLNLGRLTEAEARSQYIQQLGMPEEQVARIFHFAKETQTAVPGTLDLIQRLHTAGYPLYGLTDNVHEIVLHLRKRYDFWQHLRGVVVSAEVGHMKPEPEIYRRLLTDFSLEAERSVFIDDMPANVAGARSVGMHSFQFINAAQCENDLVRLGLQF